MKKGLKIEFILNNEKLDNFRVVLDDFPFIPRKGDQIDFFQILDTDKLSEEQSEQLFYFDWIAENPIISKYKDDYIVEIFCNAVRNNEDPNWIQL